MISYKKNNIDDKNYEFVNNERLSLTCFIEVIIYALQISQLMCVTLIHSAYIILRHLIRFL